MAKKKNEKKRKRKDSVSDSEEEIIEKHDKKVKTKHVNRNITQIVKRNPAGWSVEFQRNFWGGSPPLSVISDELKRKRKLLGILVKGAVHLCPNPVESYDESSIPESFRKVLQKSHITIPTAIQMQCIPAILHGCNVLGISPTGSGKTLAYLLPLIPHVQHQMTRVSSSRVASPIALVIVPTRELVLQVVSTCKVFNSLFHIKSLAVYGGLEKNSQVEKLRDFPTTEIIVATPGRLLDLMSSNDLVLDRVTYLVLDEADRMLALGFEEQLNSINEAIRPDRQTILFTATFPGKLRESSIKWMGEFDSINGECRGRSEAEFRQTVIVRVNTMELNTSNQASSIVSAPLHVQASALLDENPSSEVVILQSEDTTPSSVTGPSLSLTLNPAIVQHVHVCASHKKPRLLLSYLNRIRQSEKESKLRQPEPMMIFSSKIKTINFLLKLLKKHNHTGINILHGQLAQQNRETILNDFKAVSANTLFGIISCRANFTL